MLIAALIKRKNLGPIKDAAQYVTSIWTEHDFDSFGWHDNHVHGFRIVECDHGTGLLILDLDYILEWICPEYEQASFRFRVAPASLIFREVTSLRLSLDYATPTAGLGPFSIDDIEREPLSIESGCETFRWKIDINWPDGRIEFESPGFTQTLTGEVVETDSQYLTKEERSKDL